MDCETFGEKVDAAGLQALDAGDLGLLRDHLERGCGRCAARFGQGLAWRRALDRLRREEGGGRARRARRILTARVVAFLVVGGVVVSMLALAQRLAERAAEKRFLDRLEKAVVRYRLLTGEFPDPDRPLAVCLQDEAAVMELEPSRRGPRGMVLDSWGNPYRLRVPGERNPDLFDLWSAGPDLREQQGRGDDMRNWQPGGP